MYSVLVVRAVIRAIHALEGSLATLHEMTSAWAAEARIRRR
jgi:hypothetical protein